MQNVSLISVSRRQFWSIVWLVGLMILASEFAFAALYESGSLSFQTQGQSMWGTGDAFTLDEELFLGGSWDEGPITIGGIIGDVTTTTIPNPEWAAWALLNGPYLLSCESWTGCLDFLKVGDEPPKTISVTVDTRTGAEASASTSGKVGFNLGVEFDGGSVDAAVSYNASLNIPDTLQVNEFFSLNPLSNFVGDQSLSTSFGEIAAWIEAVFGVTADLSAQACAFGFGCESGSTTIGFDPQTLELLSLEDGEIKILGILDPAFFQFGSPIDLPPNTPGVNFGNVTVHLPEIETSGGLDNGRLTSSGESDFLDIRADLDGLMLFALGLPSVLEGSISFGPANVSYNLIDVEVGPTFKLVQDFWLDLTLMVDLEFSSPVFIEGIGETTTLTTPWDMLPDLALLDYGEVTVMPEFYIDAWFTNATTLGLDGVFTVDALTAGFSLEAFGLSWNLGEIGVGQVYEARTDLLTFPSLYDERFRLGGFERIEGESFVLRAVIPEPGTILLFGVGLIGLIGLKWKLKK